MNQKTLMHDGRTFHRCERCHRPARCTSGICTRCVEMTEQFQEYKELCAEVAIEIAERARLVAWHGVEAWIGEQRINLEPWPNTPARPLEEDLEDELELAERGLGRVGIDWELERQADKCGPKLPQTPSEPDRPPPVLEMPSTVPEDLPVMDSADLPIVKWKELKGLILGAGDPGLPRDPGPSFEYLGPPPSNQVSPGTWAADASELTEALDEALGSFASSTMASCGHERRHVFGSYCVACAWDEAGIHGSGQAHDETAGAIRRGRPWR